MIISEKEAADVCYVQPTEELKKKLSPEEYAVLVEAATEPPSRIPTGTTMPQASTLTASTTPRCSRPAQNSTREPAGPASGSPLIRTPWFWLKTTPMA